MIEQFTTFFHFITGLFSLLFQKLFIPWPWPLLLLGYPIYGRFISLSPLTPLFYNPPPPPHPYLDISIHLPRGWGMGNMHIFWKYCFILSVLGCDSLFTCCLSIKYFADMSILNKYSYHAFYNFSQSTPSFCPEIPRRSHES